MKQVYVTNIQAGDNIEDFFMIKSFAVKTASNNKKYCDISLLDKTGEINAKMWEVPTDYEQFTENIIIKIRGMVSEWNGTNQIVIVKMRLSTTKDNCETKDFLQTAPEPADKMYAYILKYADGIQDVELKQLTIHILSTHTEKLNYYPAAKKNHHAVTSGLLYHIKRMLQMAEKMCEVYTNLRKDHLYCGVILHDIGKLYEMDANEYGIVKDYTVEGHLLGHIIQGIKLVEKTGHELGIEKEKLLMIEHMILSHHNEPEFGSPKRPMFPEAEMLHYLDLIDSRVYDMESALAQTEPGDLSSKIWTMHNRKLYKSKN